MSEMVDFLRRGLARAKDQDSGGGTGSAASEPNDPDTSASLGPADFDPDHPLSPGYKEDRLGFRSVAGMLASSLLRQATNRGLVVSIEGVWGSGKSSLVNLLVCELQGSQKHTPEIVRFEPWLVGDRDGMLVELMSDLASAVKSIEVRGNRRKEIKGKTKTLAKKLRGYAAVLSRRSIPLARLAEAAGLPGAGLAATGLAAGAEILNTADVERPLWQTKADLIDELNSLDRRIVVIVDDLDRLEPRESAEMMRLIRAVADFPNIIYVLCYDRNILSANLGKAISVEDGASFLEKIVQVTFKVPQPEAFDLRKWIFEECVEFYGYVSGRELPDDERRRLHSVCDVEGQLLKTPRDVVRTLNAVRLHWPPVAEKTDYADLVWLQMVKLRDEALYEWIEHYLVEYAALSEGGIIHDDDRKAMSLKLKEHMSDSSAIGARSLWVFKKFIPGIRLVGHVNDTNYLFNHDTALEVGERENNKRLASTTHFRYYFAFAKSYGAMDDKEFYHFISSAEDGDDVGRICMDLIRERRPQGGVTPLGWTRTGERFDGRLGGPRGNERWPDRIDDTASSSSAKWCRSTCMARKACTVWPSATTSAAI